MEWTDRCAKNVGSTSHIAGECLGNSDEENRFDRTRTIASLPPSEDASGAPMQCPRLARLVLPEDLK